MSYIISLKSSFQPAQIILRPLTLLELYLSVWGTDTYWCFRSASPHRCVYHWYIG